MDTKYSERILAFGMWFVLICIWVGIIFIFVSLSRSEPVNVPILSNATKELLLDVCDDGGAHNLYLNGTKSVSYSFADPGGIQVLTSGTKDLKAGFYGPSFTATILSVEVTEPGYDFTTLNTNITSGSITALTVNNTGDGEENYKIRASDTAEWILGTTPDIEQFVLQSAFHATQPNNSDATWENQGYVNTLTTTDQNCADNYFSIDGTQRGTYVEVNEPRSLWLRIKTPIVNGTGEQQNSTLSITAEATEE